MTARVTPIQLLPVRKHREIVSVIRRCKERVRCEAKGNLSDGIKGPAILLKGKYFFSFCSQHFCPRFAGFRVVFLEVLTRRLTGYSFRVLILTLIQCFFFFT